MLQPDRTVTASHYSKQPRQLNRELIKKRPQLAAEQRKVILLHDDGRPYVAKESFFTKLCPFWFPSIQIKAAHVVWWTYAEDVRKRDNNWIA